MNEQWPSERYAEEGEAFAKSSFKTARDFINLLNLLPRADSKSFGDLVSWIVKQDGDLSELERRSTPIADEFLPPTQDSHTLLMTLACAAALARAPSLQTWSKVNSFKYNSSELEHWLGEAMIAYVEAHSYACNAYTKLAKEAFAALGNFSLQSKSRRTNIERDNAWAGWSEGQGKLEDIWWGLRGWHGFMNYEEELPLFRVFYKLAPDEFICTISRSSNPYLVSALLFVAGIGAFFPRFSEWKRMVAAAPVAFEEDGKWNGSVLMPLLLVEARNQLFQVRHDIHNPDELDAIKIEITNTTELIATALAERNNTIAIVARWTPWLIRQILGQTEKEFADVRSSAFADNALIDAIGSKLDNQALPQNAPEDAPLWEAWCYHCAVASFAYNRYTQKPDWTSFRDEWSISPEDWAGDKGHLLREHASLICTMNKEIPGLAANLLAFPIVQSHSPVKAWITLWEDAFTLREIVEFGDAGATDDEYSSRSEAGRLLLLLFSIGLAIFDQIAVRSSAKNSAEARSLAKLFKALISATSEMREIDNTLNHDKWLPIVQHLAIRRMIWQPSPSDKIASTNYQVFRADDTPTVSDILINEKGNVIEMVAMLQSLLLNAPDSKLKSVLSSASIDVSGIVQSIRSLNEYHPMKYPIDVAQLEKLEALT